MKANWLSRFGVSMALCALTLKGASEPADQEVQQIFGGLSQLTVVRDVDHTALRAGYYDVPVARGYVTCLQQPYVIVDGTRFELWGHYDSAIKKWRNASAMGTIVEYPTGVYFAPFNVAHPIKENLHVYRNSEGMPILTSYGRQKIREIGAVKSANLLLNIAANKDSGLVVFAGIGADKYSLKNAIEERLHPLIYRVISSESTRPSGGLGEKKHALIEHCVSLFWDALHEVRTISGEKS